MARIVCGVTVSPRACMLNFPLGALARLGLARAYAMQRDTAKARAAYQDFLTLWKHADRDLPILIAAESEYAKLKWPFEFLEKGSPLLARSRQLPAG